MSKIWKSVGTFPTYVGADGKRKELLQENPDLEIRVRKRGCVDRENLRFVVKQCVGTRVGEKE